jgi:hypothetical protein
MIPDGVLLRRTKEDVCDIRAPSHDPRIGNNQGGGENAWRRELESAAGTKVPSERTTGDKTPQPYFRLLELGDGGRGLRCLGQGRGCFSGKAREHGGTLVSCAMAAVPFCE